MINLLLKGLVCPIRLITFAHKGAEASNILKGFRGNDIQELQASFLECRPLTENMECLFLYVYV